ncbi:Killing trait domain-containing protein [Lysobacter sp. cf310]|nr:Killing trait domain-containing protein [Lysobacter sp. cf310]
MSFPTAVNDQITDAVTQSNVKVIGEAPAFAMGSIYQSMAHSTGILFQNAVAAQQQQNILMQAAVNQGVMQIYSIDTMAAAGAEQLQATAEHSAAGLKNTASSAGVSSQIVDAVKQSLHDVLGSAGDFSYAVRCAAEAMQAALDDINESAQHESMRTLQLAATAACLRAMIADPDKADAYAGVLDTIRRLS